MAGAVSANRFLSVTGRRGTSRTLQRNISGISELSQEGSYYEPNMSPDASPAEARHRVNDDTAGAGAMGSLFSTARSRDGGFQDQMSETGPHTPESLTRPTGRSRPTGTSLDAANNQDSSSQVSCRPVRVCRFVDPCVCVCRYHHQHFVSRGPDRVL